MTNTDEKVNTEATQDTGTRVCAACGERKSIADDFIHTHHAACRICVLRSNARRKGKVGDFARERLRQLGVNVHHDKE